MGFFAWIILGLIAGAIARMILPGSQGSGWIGALITGVLGAMLGGWIASALFHVNVNEKFFDLGTWFWAILGGVIVAAIWQAVSRRMGRGTRV